jgi:hypothetical protein
MGDPLTIGVVGAAALTEGIGFLYGQAGEALKRWRERKAAKEAVKVEPVDVELPAVFQGYLDEPRLDLEAVERLEPDLRDLRAAVAEYAQGIDELDPRDRELLETVDALRRAMEAVYRQRLVFKGEPTSPEDVQAVGEAKVEEVLGYVAGLRARRIIGSARGRVEVGKVGPGGQAVGLEADTIG